LPFVRIGLVLAAGGSVGVAYHGAALAALEEATGWDPRSADVMVGTSAGALTAAMLRAGVPADDMARISEGDPLSEEGARLAAVGRPHRPRPSLADALSFRPVADPAAVLRAFARPWTVSPKALAVAAMPSGGISTDAISGGIDAVYEGRWPDRPLWLCSWDLRGGRRVVFGQPGAPAATVGQAVAASCAIPVYFKPVTIEGRRYVDGGVHSMVNLDLVADVGLDLVVAVSPMSQAAMWGALSPGVFMRQPLRARLQAEVAALKRTGVPVVAIQPGRSVISAMGLNPMDAARRGAVSRATRAGVRRWLREGTEGRHLARVLRVAASGGATATSGHQESRQDPA
jgi:NTE family protein